VALKSLTDKDLRNTARTEAVIMRIRDAIRQGSLSPNDRLTELGIAEQLGVSRTPVREAMERLIADGLLSQVGPRGTTVTQLNREQVLQLYSLREVLEGAAASFAAQHASSVEMDAIMNLHDMMENPKHSPRTLAELNEDFHRAIYAAAHNEYLDHTACRMADFLILLKGTTYSAPERPKQAQIEHKTIIQAIAKRDAESAEKASRKHIREASRVRLRMMFEGK